MVSTATIPDPANPNGTITVPTARARALPDGEIVAGTPIPAVVPLPGKPMAVMPGKVTVVPKVVGRHHRGQQRQGGPSDDRCDRGRHRL